MGELSAKARSWYEIVASELARSGVPLPVDLILGVIDVESGGTVGSVHPGSRAAGLMQVLPGTLAEYNKHHTIKIPYDVLTQKNLSAGAQQIRVGLWVLATYWKSAYRYLRPKLGTLPIEQLAKIADLFYRAGPGATKKRLDKLSSPTFEALVSASPDWEPLRHVRRLFDRVDPQWDLGRISDWLDKAEPTKQSSQGVLIAAIVFLLALYLLRKDKNNAIKKESSS